MSHTKELATFLSNYSSRSFQKGEIIFHQGDIPTHAYIVQNGVIKNYTIDKTGVERPVVFDTRLEMFPISWIFSLTEACIYYYEAMTDCSVWVVPREDIMELGYTNPIALQDLYQRLMKRQLDTQLRIEALEQAKAYDKIIYTLRFLCSRFGNPLPHNNVQVTLSITQQDFANFLGLTRETTAIELKKLSQAGVIQYHRSNYTVRMDKIQHIIDELD